MEGEYSQHPIEMIDRFSDSGKTELARLAVYQAFEDQMMLAQRGEQTREEAIAKSRALGQQILSGLGVELPR